MLSTFEMELAGEFKAKNALRHIEALAGIGDRFIGTVGDEKAITYVEQEFRKYGLEIVRTPIEVPSFEDRGARIKIIATGEQIEAIPAYFSPATPAGGIAAEMVFVNGGEEEDYRSLDVRGKIVLLSEEGLGYSRFWLGTFARLAAQRGALGMIIIHPMPWSYRMSMEAGNSKIESRFLPEQLPAVCVSAIDGLRLMRAMGSGAAMIHYQSNTVVERRKSYVVSGLFRGTELPQERVGILAHRDNGFPPGANDNGSGTGTMLELVRVLTRHRYRRTIEFISSTSEEGVTQGIYEYIQQHKEDLQKNMKALFDLDMFGVGGRLNLVDLGYWPDSKPIKHDEELMQMIESIADDFGYYVGRMTASWGVAESGRFLEIGVPAVWFWRADDPYYHSRHDTADKIDGNALKAVGDLTAVAAARVLNR
ncbi:MAG: M20/M25/M40 family metallo-hydrolase [Bacillota bacterium]